MPERAGMIGKPVQAEHQRPVAGLDGREAHAVGVHRGGLEFWHRGVLSAL